MSLGSLGNARFERALDGVASQIVCSIGQAEFHQRFRLPEPNAGESLEVPAIHLDTLKLSLPELVPVRDKVRVGSRTEFEQIQALALPFHSHAITHEAVQQAIHAVA